MTSYSFETIHCPTCRTRQVGMSLASGNSFGARYFTDGHTEGDSFDGESPIRICAVCGHRDWVSRWPEGAPSSEREYFDSKAKHLMAGYDFMEYVSERLWVDEKEEFYLRTLAWWQSNRDESKELDAAAMKSRRRNIEALLAQWEGSGAHPLMKAELLRHLSRFDECVAWIRASGLESNADASKSAAAILRLAQERSTRAEQITK